ncbi:MAG: enoyl-CoA hydratase/isomerase family protein [Rubrivivax sp.]|nr:enoyl-CoA hydratase/isomerase family protein [Rubrivivax sp.]
MNTPAPYQAIAVAHDGPVATVTLNRPQARNAMTMGMVLELHSALEDAEHDGQTRVIVLRGAGGHFSAGADIKEMAAARMRLAADSEAIVKTSAAFGDLCVAYSRTPLALVAVPEGTVMGGGFGLTCVADVVVAGETAVFRLPETSLGVVPAQIAPFLVERLGYSEAKRLAVTGGQFDAREALALRLVHEVHAPDALDAAVARVVRQILQSAPRALGATKALIARARLHTPESLVPHAAEVFSHAALSEEGTEGQTAFLARRKAKWMPT